MNIENLFSAVRNDPDQATLVVAVRELERQGYKVTVNDKYSGSETLVEAEGNGELDLIPKQNGAKVRITRGGEVQSFRIQFIDIDAVCITELDTPPIMYDPEFTTRFFRSGETN